MFYQFLFVNLLAFLIYLEAFVHSSRWKIELREYDNPRRVEVDLIRELHPLFNTTYRPALSDRERGLYKRLIAEEITYRIDNPAEDLIRYMRA